MPLRKTIEVIVKLANEGVIGQYAIAGAVAALNYIQPTLTEDLDVLVSLGGFEQRRSGLILLTPIEEALGRLGYTERSDVGVWVEGWPVQFLPAASQLDEEALSLATEVEFHTGDEPAVRARILTAEHVVATALRLGRLKDLARVDAFLEQGVVDLPKLKAILQRHDLMPAWKLFLLKSGNPDLLS
ncbi:MAG: hypothetical protein NTV97_04070 [Alphaproteobacteria bacterium]|nr:hypothetical protein [Alphaproteobacteria bacterium]